MSYKDYKAMRAYWGKYPPVNVSVALFLGCANQSTPTQRQMTGQEIDYLASKIPAKSVSGDEMINMLEGLGVPWLRKK